MKVYFGSDNHGDKLRPELASYVNNLGYEIEDLGTHIDFPVITKILVRKVLEYKGNFGILLCETGQGMSIAANRNKGIRAAVCNTIDEAKNAREHLDANVLTLGADQVKDYYAKAIVETFLSTEFIEKDRYKRRIEQMG